MSSKGRVRPVCAVPRKGNVRCLFIESDQIKHRAQGVSDKILAKGFDTYCSSVSDAVGIASIEVVQSFIHPTQPRLTAVIGTGASVGGAFTTGASIGGAVAGRSVYVS